MPPCLLVIDSFARSILQQQKGISALRRALQTGLNRTWRWIRAKQETESVKTQSKDAVKRSQVLDAVLALLDTQVSTLIDDGASATPKSKGRQAPTGERVRFRSSARAGREHGWPGCGRRAAAVVTHGRSFAERRGAGTDLELRESANQGVHASGPTPLPFLSWLGRVCDGSSGALPDADGLALYGLRSAVRACAGRKSSRFWSSPMRRVSCVAVLSAAVVTASPPPQHSAAGT